MCLRCLAGGLSGRRTPERSQAPGWLLARAKRDSRPAAFRDKVRTPFCSHQRCKTRQRAQRALYTIILEVCPSKLVIPAPGASGGAPGLAEPGPREAPGPAGARLCRGALSGSGAATAAAPRPRKRRQPPSSSV